MNEAPYILSLAYKKQIDEVCQSLPALGLKHCVMYLIFNDGSTFVLSNVYSILKPYYYEALYKEDYTCSNELIQQDYYLINETSSVSSGLKERLSSQFNVYPIYNIIRSHSECTFVFSAIRDAPMESAQLFYEKTVKKFELFCIQFVDAFLDLIVRSNPAYRFSFVLNNKSLRHAIIRQGYEKEIILSAREQECLWHAGQGKSSKEIAQILQISPYTVEQYLKRIRDVFNCNKLPEIMMECIHRGIIGKVSYFNKKQPAIPGRYQPILTQGRPVI